MLEFKVYGYPYPITTLRHNGVIILNGTKMDSMYIRQDATKMYNGDYMCTAENLLGIANVTRKVKIIGEAFALIDRSLDQLNERVSERVSK